LDCEIDEGLDQRPSCGLHPFDTERFGNFSQSADPLDHLAGVPLAMGDRVLHLVYGGLQRRLLVVSKRRRCLQLVHALAGSQRAALLREIAVGYGCAEAHRPLNLLHGLGVPSERLHAVVPEHLRLTFAAEVARRALVSR
jgi:hypothetical protein